MNPRIVIKPSRKLCLSEFAVTSPGGILLSVKKCLREPGHPGPCTDGTMIWKREINNAAHS